MNCKSFDRQAILILRGSDKNNQLDEDLLELINRCDCSLQSQQTDGMDEPLCEESI